MLGKRGSELRIGCEHPQKHHFRTSWVQPIKTHIDNVPQIDWTCPPRFLADPNWKMEAGSESQEKHIQLHRESKIAEAIYYHKSAIPPDPYVAPSTLDFNDGSRIPVIPLDVINDETSPNDPLIPPGPTAKPGEKITQPRLPRDKVIGTAIALVALIKSKEPGSQIDLELLIQLLCNPGMLENLTKEHGLSTNQSSVITNAQPHEISSVPMPAVGGYSTWLPSAPFGRCSLSQDVRNMIEQIHSNSESQNPSSNKKVDVGKLRKPKINEYGLGDRPAEVKDVGYYRRLISLHGMAQQNDKPQGSVKLTGSREQRPCVFFNGPNGCRHGSVCRFQHVKGGFGGGGQAVEEQHSAKRMKFSVGIFARHTWTSRSV